MAGGTTTPELVGAASNAGALGIIAGGLASPQTMADQLLAARALTSAPLGVNLFVPQPIPQNADEIEAYAQTLVAETHRYGVALGTPQYSDHDWADKLEIIHDLKPELVSFTFGFPATRELARMRGAGITTLASVASPVEAQVACDRGFDAVVVQGPKAGGHRFTLDPGATPPTQPLATLLAAVTNSCDVPVIAAGGLANHRDLEQALHLGAVAGQFGTAFLLADEAGTPEVHRRALTDSTFAKTSVTRAFTGRYARSLHNRFIDDHGADGISAFPNVAFLTGPVLAAAARIGDPNGTSLWAGVEFRQSVSGPAASIVASLA